MGFDPANQMPVGSLHVALLVWTGDVNGVRFGLQVATEGGVGLVERALIAAAFDRVGRSRRVVGPQLEGHAAQGPVRGLHPGFEGNKRLRKANARTLPVAARQHEMAEQMLEGYAGDRDPEFRGSFPVELGGPSWLVCLGKEYFLRRAVQCPPHLYAPLESPQSDGSRQLRLGSLQVRQQPLHLDLRGRFQIAHRLWHDVLQRIGPGSVRPRPTLLLDLFGTGVRLQIARCRLRVHVCLHGSVADHAAVRLILLHELPVLSRGDHGACVRAPSITAHAGRPHPQIPLNRTRVLVGADLDV